MHVLARLLPLTLALLALAAPHAAALEPVETPVPIGTPAVDVGSIVVTTPAVPGFEVVLPAVAMPAHDAEATVCGPSVDGGAKCWTVDESGEEKTIYAGGTWFRHSGYDPMAFDFGSPRAPAIVLVPEGAELGVEGEPAECVVVGEDGAHPQECRFGVYLLVFPAPLPVTFFNGW